MTTTLEHVNNTTGPTAVLDPNKTRVILSALDRCDKGDCGAAAMAHIEFPSGISLVFCRHHTEESRVQLEGKGAIIDTQYDSLFTKLDVSA